MEPTHRNPSAPEVA